MALEYAILGFLAYQPLSGYDLKKRFDNSVRHFWSADQSQIYRTLARLTDQGWVAMEVIEQTERPDRKVYHITEAGRTELLRWIKDPIPVPEMRSAPLIQVFFAGQLSNAELLAKFEEAAAMMRGMLERYQPIPMLIQQYEKEFGTPRDAFCWMLTLELGLETARTQLAWAESVIERIRAGQIPEPEPAP